MRTLLLSPLLLAFVALSIGSSGSTMEDDDGGPVGGDGDGGGEVEMTTVPEEVVDGIAAAETYTLAVVEGSGDIGGLSITTYTGTAACSLSDPVGDAYEIYVNLERNSGCDYTTTVCTEDDLCFSGSAGSVWANKYVSNSLADTMRASAGAIVMNRDIVGFDDICTIAIDIGWPDGTSFSATYEVEYQFGSLCYEITPAAE